MSVAPALEVVDLTKRFGSTVAVDSLTFTVAPGKIAGFVGGNGAGKTTTMRMILGLTKPCAGSVVLGGRPLEEFSELRPAVGAQLDNLGGHPGLTGRQHLSLLASASGVPSERVDELLEMVGLSDAANKRIGKYSTGMQRRLGLAGALLVPAPLLVLDEPSNGLDPGGIRWLRSQLRTLADAGTAVFVSTHQLAELGTIVDDLVVLHNGRLVTSGPVEELLDRAAVDSIEDLLLAGAPLQGEES